jgi:hypothetical protein
MPSDLVRRQQHFAEYLGWLLLWIRDQGWASTLAEGYVGDSIDRPEEDTPHLRRGLHFRRLAQDLNLWVAGELITRGTHPAWTTLGGYWESLDPECRWGGRFGDMNHCSLTDGAYAVRAVLHGDAEADRCPFQARRAHGGGS